MAAPLIANRQDRPFDRPRGSRTMEIISNEHRSTARLLPSAPSHLRASDVVFAHNRFDPFSSDNRVLETVPSLR